METYNGHVRTPQDAIILFEACRIGLLPRVQRRLSEKERQQIKSGSVFVWDEREAGMRRWTDGKSWSASRVSGSFLTYREMEGKRGGNGFATPQAQPKKPPSKSVDEARDNDSEQDYPEGPDGYRYKPDGLMKQSFSITTSQGQHLHLISYYARSQATAPPLKQPSTDPTLRNIRPAKGLYPEASVNESSNVPAVTRGPMPGSPYAAAPPPGMGSPYSHPGMPPVMYPAYPTGSWPGSPQGTPPQYYQAYGFYPPGHSPLQHGHQMYPPGAVYAGPYHIQGPTQFDRPPPPLPHTSLPPPPPTANGHVPPGLAAIRSPYAPTPVAQAHSTAALHSSPYANGAVDPALEATSRSPNGTNGITAPTPTTNGAKPPTPPPTTAPTEASRSTEPPSQQPQEATSNGSSTPAKVFPSIGVLLNNEVHTNGTTEAQKPIDRAGSHSPAGAQRGAGRGIPDLKLPLLAEDMRATKALDSVFSKHAGTKV